MNCPIFRYFIAFPVLASLICVPTATAQSQDSKDKTSSSKLHGRVATASPPNKPVAGSTLKNEAGHSSNATKNQIKGKAENKTLQDKRDKFGASNKEVYLNIQDGTVCQNGGAKKNLQIGDNRINIVGTARFEIKGPGEIRIKGRGTLSVIGKGTVEIDQTSTIKAANFDSITTVDKLDLHATDCGHVSASSPAKINADHCNDVVSLGEADVTAEHCKTVSLVYSNTSHEIKDGVVEASDCQTVTFSGGDLDERAWQSEPPRLIAKNCDTVRIYNGSARAIGCSTVELFGGKLEVKDCQSVKNLKPDSNVITDL